MHLPPAICLLLAAFLSTVSAQRVQATSLPLNCETLCSELFMAIRDNPAQMVMRLEEALIIHDACAGELVTAAMDAVNADPARVRQIFKTAMDVAPERSTTISAAVKHYSAPTVVAAQGGEVRRAVLPTLARAQPLPGEELRRAELPLATRNLPIVEVRRAEVPTQAAPSINLMSVPRARVMK
ncbi:hypothetical protein [Prosthecobacter sp.]